MCHAAPTPKHTPPRYVTAIACNRSLALSLCLEPCVRHARQGLELEQWKFHHLDGGGVEAAGGGLSALIFCTVQIVQEGSLSVAEAPAWELGEIAFAF